MEKYQIDRWQANKTDFSAHRVATLPYLPVLEIGSELSALLNIILLPKLSSLTVYSDTDSVELDLSSLIERSRSVVEALFSSTTIAAAFIRLLHVFSSLTSLSLHSLILEDKAFSYANNCRPFIKE